MKPAAPSILVLLALTILASSEEKPKPPKITESNLTEMEELVKRGADPNAPIRYSRMLLANETEPPAELGSYFPLDAAIDRLQIDLVRRLLALGAKPRGNELADVAFKSFGDSSVEFAKLLVKAGVDPNSLNSRFYGPALTAAAYRGNLPLVKFLLEQPGIEVNLRDIDGRTALMPAAKGGHLEIVEMLLQAGADPSLKNLRGQTAAAEAQAEIDRRQAAIARLRKSAFAGWTGIWRVAYSNGIEQVHELSEDGAATASADAHQYVAQGQMALDGENLSITYEDDHQEKWTRVGARMIVEHWSMVSRPEKTVKVIGIGERVADSSRTRR